MSVQVSALVINYNYEQFLADALWSVLGQSMPPSQVIVADDGSSDSSDEVCAAFAHLGVRFVSGAHVGLAENLSRGLGECNGTHVAFVSSDDVWQPGHLALAATAFATRPDAAVAYSSVEFIDQQGNVIAPRTSARKRRAMPSGWIDPYSLLPNQFIPTQAAVVRRDALESVGGIDTSLEYAELDLFVRLATAYPIVYTGRATVWYRLHEHSLSRDHERALRNRLALYDKHLPLASDTKRRLIARAHAKTAYRQLRHADDPGVVRAARGHILVAFATAPLTMVRPLEVSVLLGSFTGRLFVVFRHFLERRISRHGGLRLALQRLLWWGR